MTPTPPPVYNFVKDPVLTRGQYDYHLATDDELYEGYDDPLFPNRKQPSGYGAKKEEKKEEK
jgi:cytochrome c oxidase subunit 1